MAALGKRHFCGHCQDYVSKTVYHLHKRLYFDTISKKWASCQVFFEDGKGLDSFKPGAQTSSLENTSVSGNDCTGMFM